MNKLFITLFIFIFSAQLFAQADSASKETAEQKIGGSHDLPLELNLLLDSLQANNAEGKPTRLSSSTVYSIMHIDSYARMMSKEDIFLLGKIEIYKTLLKTNEFFPRAAVSGNEIKILKAAIKNSSDPFIKWFLQALLQDCESLLSSAIFKEYLLQKNTGHLEQLSMKKIDKKVQIIYRWVSKILVDSPDFQEPLKADLVPAMIEALKNIEESFFLMVSSTSFEAMPPIISKTADFKFFSHKKVKPMPIKTPAKEKSVEEILAPITDEGKAQAVTLPEPSKEDWLSDEFAPANLKNLPKPSDDADWLQDF